MRDGYEIPENDLRYICRMLGLPEETPQSGIPQSVYDQYCEDRVRADRIGLYFSARDLLCIVSRASLRGEDAVPVPETEVPSVADLFRAKKVQPGELVLCRWRGGDRQVVLKGIRGNQLLVDFGGDMGERRVDDERVSLLTEGEQ